MSVNANANNVRNTFYAFVLVFIRMVFCKLAPSKESNDFLGSEQKKQVVRAPRRVFTSHQRHQARGARHILRQTPSKQHL